MHYEGSFHRGLREPWGEAQLTTGNKVHAVEFEGVLSIAVLMETSLLLALSTSHRFVCTVSEAAVCVWGGTCICILR